MDREDTLGEASMLLLPLIATALATQGIQGLSLGQKVRVHFMAPAPVLALSIPLAGPRLGEGHIAGTLTDYRPFESVAVERKGWIAGIGPTTQRTIDWVQITRIETAQPRNALNVIRGATGGFGAAILLTAASMFVIRPFCDAPPGAGSECPGFWSTTGRIAVYSVPLGAVVGYFSTRWKSVYRRQEPHV